MCKIQVRRLPFYSELLTSLGPAAARELTQHDDDPNTVFERLHDNSKARLPRRRHLNQEQQHLFGDDEEDFADWRTRTGRAHEAGTYTKRSRSAREDMKSCSASSSSSSRRSGRALDLSFQREVQTIELALRRREVLGVGRWLQLQQARRHGACVAFETGQE